MEKNKKEKNEKRDLNACFEKYPEIQEALDAMNRTRINDNAKASCNFENVPVYFPKK